MFPTLSSAVPVFDLRTLKRGDTIEVYRLDTVAFRGRVDAIAPHLGVLWIQQDAWHERRLVDFTEHKVWKL